MHTKDRLTEFITQRWQIVHGIPRVRRSGDAEAKGEVKALHQLQNDTGHTQKTGER